MDRFRQFSWFKALLVLGISSGLVGAMVYYFSLEAGPIYNFVYERDAKEILDIFDKDWYILVDEEDRSKYDIDFRLRHQSRNKNPRNWGKMVIKVLRDENNLKGFITYFKRSFYKWFILFLAVGRHARGKGYGTQLVNYALKDIAKRDPFCKVVELDTRVGNFKARNLYKKLGFEEVDIDDEYVTFQKEIVR